uniref:Uncharacterized protein n=1 Tax=Pyxicephalus adspersus TaxID=30357 RepID=A0AAV3AGJ3_PYXAD|nr:TPA: hypothetical protein GDO54_011052 [Pyxicephalus adspersus]
MCTSQILIPNGRWRQTQQFTLHVRRFLIKKKKKGTFHCISSLIYNILTGGFVVCSLYNQFYLHSNSNQLNVTVSKTSMPT